MNLTTGQLNALKEGFDSMIGFFGKECKLFYQPKIIDCPDCSKLVNNSYSQGSFGTHGGPQRIDQMGVCFLCGGSGKRQQEYSENITMSCEWNPKGFINAAGISLPTATLRTRGYLFDIIKIKKCIELRLQVPIENYVVGRYKLNSEASDSFNIVQGRYFIAYWDRINA